MYGHLQVPLSPKDGLILRGLGIARISTEHQNEKSLDEQIAKIKAYVEQAYDGPIEWEFLASRGSGENLDRQELFEPEERIAGGLLDLVIAKDLARICRRKRAYDFCESCVDNDVRLIAINIDDSLAVSSAAGRSSPPHRLGEQLRDAGRTDSTAFPL